MRILKTSNTQFSNQNSNPHHFQTRPTPEPISTTENSSQAKLPAIKQPIDKKELSQYIWRVDNGFLTQYINQTYVARSANYIGKKPANQVKNEYNNTLSFTNPKIKTTLNKSI